MMVRISKIISRIDQSIENLNCLRRELITAQSNEAAMARMKMEHQANQHGDNPMGKDGEAR